MHSTESEREPAVVALGDAINTATRSVHTKLNKLILLRLPLALPPQRPNPSTYVTGLLHVAPIYTVFESLWQNILDIPNDDGTELTLDGCEPGKPLLDSESRAQCPFTEGTATDVHQPLLCDRIRTVLGHLHFDSLQRSARLRDDISTLTGWPEHVVEERLRAASRAGPLGEFVDHIKRTVEKDPHVLLAYAWVLYMALFSGGRFIRASLEAAGPSFWSQLSEPTQSCLAPADAEVSRTPSNDGEVDGQASHLRFFRFDAPADGEHLKKEFKARFSETEPLLTSGERAAIVHEAGCIFDNLMLIVAQLDEACGTGADPAAADGSVREWARLLAPQKQQQPVLGSRSKIRDSVLVAREREVDKAGRKESAQQREEAVDATLLPTELTISGGIDGDEAADATEDANKPSIEMPVAERECFMPGLKAVRFEANLPLPQRLARRLHIYSSEDSNSANEHIPRTTTRKNAVRFLRTVATAKCWLLASVIVALVAAYLYSMR